MLRGGYGKQASPNFLQTPRRKFAASEGRHPFTGGLNELQAGSFHRKRGIKFADPSAFACLQTIAGTLKSSPLRRVESTDFEEIGGGDFTVCAKLFPPS